MRTVSKIAEAVVFALAALAFTGSTAGAKPSNGLPPPITSYGGWGCGVSNPVAPKVVHPNGVRYIKAESICTLNTSGSQQDYTEIQQKIGGDGWQTPIDLTTKVHFDIHYDGQPSFLTQSSYLPCPTLGYVSLRTIDVIENLWVLSSSPDRFVVIPSVVVRIKC
jgi:hypothetical protein